MNERELRSLKRTELLELLLAQSREIEQLRSRLAQAEQQLAERRVRLANAGSIAEASLALTNIFEEAQRAVDTYMRSTTGGALGYDDLHRYADSSAASAPVSSSAQTSGSWARVSAPQPVAGDTRSHPQAAEPKTTPMWDAAVNRAAQTLGVSAEELAATGQAQVAARWAGAKSPSNSTLIADAFEDVFGASFHPASDLLDQADADTQR